MLENWRARLETRRLRQMTPSESFRHHVRKAHHDLLYTEMTVLNLARNEAEPELRRWLEDRAGRLNEMRMEFDAMSRRLWQLDAGAALEEVDESR